jgi:integrase/recombinase XerD
MVIRPVFNVVNKGLVRRSKEQIAKILSLDTTAITTMTEKEDKDKEELLLLLNRKINSVIEDFPSNLKFCELMLRDRSKLSKENAMTICDYLIAMKREINPRISYKEKIIHILTLLSRAVGIEKKFIDMTRDDILYSFLDKYRKSEKQDPLHRWIGGYNLRIVTLSRFFKWLYYPNIDDSKKRSELSALEKKPECIMGIKQLKRKEVSCYKPTDLWTQEDDLLFLKWVTNKRDRCYHTMARDLSARPHEILNLKIKDIIFKTSGNFLYAEVLVNGKTGSRHIPLIQSIPYIKEWLSNHPSRNNPNAPLFVSLTKHSMGRTQLTINGLYNMYHKYKEEFFPKLLEEDKTTTIPKEDKEKIKALLLKPFNPYIRRHSALTEKSNSDKLGVHILNQHAGWSMNSHMAQKYLHYFGNESSNLLLKSHGILIDSSNGNDSDNTLNPKVCYNCNEPNTHDAKFCSKCKMIMSFKDYQETLQNQEKALEEQKKKEGELATIKEQLNLMQSQFQMLISTLGNANKNEIERNNMAKNLYDSGLIKETEKIASATTTAAPTSSTTDSGQSLEQQQQLIKAAAKAAYHATKSKSALTKEAAAASSAAKIKSKW